MEAASPQPAPSGPSWGSIFTSALNNGFDLAAQFGAAELAERQRKTSAVAPTTTSATAAQAAASAGSTTPTAANSTRPAWMVPAIIGGAVLAVLGLGLLLRRR